MSDTLDLAIADARSLLNEPSGVGAVTDHELAKWGNEGQNLLAHAIQRSDANFFEESDQSLGFVAGTEEQDLPEVCRDRVITKVTRTDLSERVPIDPIRFQDRDSYQQIGVANGAGRHYYLRGNKIGLKPTPSSTIAANVLIHYLQLPHALHWGVFGTAADARVTTTTFKMPNSGTAATNWYLKAGRLSTRTSYYVNARIRVITGTDRGLERKITAFDVATQIATIDSAWTTANIDGVQYVILSPLKDEYKQATFHYMLRMAGIKKKNAELYRMGDAGWKEVMDSLTESAELRHYDANQYVHPPADFDLG